MDPIYSPASSGSYDGVYISKSLDATSHFEYATAFLSRALFLNRTHSPRHCRTVCDDVADVWRRATGETLVLKKREDLEVQA